MATETTRPGGDDVPKGFPDDTVPMLIDEVSGWCYSIFSPYGQRFRFFVWQCEQGYEVSLVHPPLESPNTSRFHLHPDGRLDLPMTATTPLEAFKASVMWATSLGFAIQTKGIPDALSNR